MIAIIPAYGDGELLNFYTRILAGKPLINYTIEAARKSKYIDRTHVSTNSRVIEAAANDLGVEVSFWDSTVLDSKNSNLQYIIEQLQSENDKKQDFVVLKPSTPLRSSNDIDSAFELFLEKNADSLASFCETIYSPIKAKKIVNDRVSDFFIDSSDINIEHEPDKAYVSNNAIFIFSYDFYERNGINCSGSTLPFVMVPNHCIEINSLSDFEYAEFLLVKNNQEISAIKESDIYKVLYNNSIRSSIQKLDNTGIGFITVINDSNKIMGIVTDGDFRRAVLSGVSLDDPIMTIANSKFAYLRDGYSKEEMENIFFNNDIGHIPVINNDELQEIILRKNIPFIKNRKKDEKHLNIPVVIMAGGIGNRLKPFTHIMPKPLIPIGNKPLIEIIIERFRESGVNEFYLSLNYKANMIKAYFEERSIAKHLNYIVEDIPLGTAGALKKLKGIINSTFIVSNCDIIIKSNYNKIIEFHNQGKYDLTLVACMHHFTIPYGICSIEEGGCLKEISEKPEFDYLVNTGMYILEPKIIDLIPDNTFYHITQLIEDLKINNGRVGVYPVYEKSWIDVGQWNEYRKAVKYLQ